VGLWLGRSGGALRLAATAAEARRISVRLDGSRKLPERPRVCREAAIDDIATATECLGGQCLTFLVSQLIGRGHLIVPRAPHPQRDPTFVLSSAPGDCM
jgi:hypothetical protein